MARAAVGAEEFVPDTRDLDLLADAARACRGCDLYRNANQSVFGAGAHAATIMMVGEQPGDQEDIAGAPFVGPAGRMLDKALLAAGINRDRIYLTNAVKHFKFTRAERGQRRIHKTPSRTEVVACRPWLLAELHCVQPEVLVLLGATAAKAMLGNDFRVTAHRGEVLRLPATDRPDGRDPAVVTTVHPSSILRGPPADRDAAFAGLTADLQVVAGLVGVQ